MIYTDLLAKLDTKRGDKTSRKVGNNTYLKRRGDSVAIRLHDTDVVTYAADNSATIDSGGWRTVTTKSRINEYIPGHLYTEAGVWYVGYYGATYTYCDGMTLHDDGTVSGAGKTQSKADIRREKRTTKAFASDYITALLDGDVPAPGDGDCWICLMMDTDGTGSNEHVRSHIAEQYYVPSMLVNAARTYGASIAAWSILDDIWHWKYNGRRWQGAVAGDLDRGGIDTLQRMLYRFANRCLGYQA
jgi:hypothetical protein